MANRIEVSSDTAGIAAAVAVLIADDGTAVQAQAIASTARTTAAATVRRRAPRSTFTAWVIPMMLSRTDRVPAQQSGGPTMLGLTAWSALERQREIGAFPGTCEPSE
ncbi:hypothetical protein MALV_57040 (plasmid) [Mycolicibacterium alvei]|uniref:Uncharacterized protein n=1 Tax=Mycolicibacterium alvei TaxID=67081 RepID=A0A6N4V1N1_9MYCO|nr:hypothetical protein MALV_57040 [Mycolicibacterium alvei]